MRQRQLKTLLDAAGGFYLAAIARDRSEYQAYRRALLSSDLPRMDYVYGSWRIWVGDKAIDRPGPQEGRVRIGDKGWYEEEMREREAKRAILAEYAERLSRAAAELGMSANTTRGMDSYNSLWPQRKMLSVDSVIARADCQHLASSESN